MLRSLESCAYSANILKETLNKIQKAVDDLSLRQYSNLHAWVGKLDEAVEAKLSLRLQVTPNYFYLPGFNPGLSQVKSGNSWPSAVVVVMHRQSLVKKIIR